MYLIKSSNDISLYWNFLEKNSYFYMSLYFSRLTQNYVLKSVRNNTEKNVFQLHLNCKFHCLHLQQLEDFKQPIKGFEGCGFQRAQCIINIWPVHFMYPRLL